jgi:NAD+ synthase (glutamine-hydrolysing)
MQKTRKQRLRTALAQINVIPGQPALNTAVMLKAIAAAKRKKAELIVFPEMAIPGYLIGDNWEREAFLRECEACGHKIRAAASGIAVIFGNVGLDWTRKNEDGRVRKYNALFIAENKKFIRPQKGTYDFIIKTLSPNYREFDESRYFYDLRKLALELKKEPEDLISPVRAGRLNLGCVICEDAWDRDYGFSPLKILTGQPLDIIINCSSSPFTLNKNIRRRKIFAEQCVRMRKPLIYVNNVGIQNNGKTVYAFDGSSCVFDAFGNCRPVCGRFKEEVAIIDISLAGSSFAEPIMESEEGIGIIDEALVFGLRAFLGQCHIKRVVVGISGGIDSAVTACLCRRVLSPGNILLVNMPGRFTSPTTIALARQTLKNLGCYYVEIPIEKSVRHTVAQIDRLEIRSPDGALRSRLRINTAILENIQARDRSARILAAVAAAFGGAFTCNANKAETTVGYSTMYGDLAGFLAPVGDLWKHEIYALAGYMNNEIFHREVIPAGCFSLTPSAELSAAQNVDKKMGDPLYYPYHDRLFASWIERWNRITPEEILDWHIAGKLESEIGYSGKIKDIFKSNRAFVADLERWWNQYCGLAIAKRIQAPPILAVHRRTFGFGHREAQLPVWYSGRYFKLKQQLLSRKGGVAAVH